MGARPIAALNSLRFGDLKQLCALTDGNLNRHLHALAEMEIVTTARVRGNGRPTTFVCITPSGRARFLAYIDALESVIRTVHAGERAAAPAFGRLATSQ